MNIDFKEYRPSPSPDTLVQTYWTGDFNLYAEKGFSQSVLPNGCVELIIHLSHDHCELAKDESWGRSPVFTLIGLQTAPYEVRFNKLVRVFGIRFYPEGIFTLFGIPAALFTDTFENSRGAWEGFQQLLLPPQGSENRKRPYSTHGSLPYIT